MVLTFLVCLISHVENTYAQIYSPLARFWLTPASSVRTLSISQTTLLTSLMHFWLPSPNLFRTSSLIKQNFELFTYSCAVFTPRSRYSLKWVSSKAYHFLRLFLMTSYSRQESDYFESLWTSLYCSVDHLY